MDDKDRQIRERAHALWEAEGRPHGKDLLHWDQAAAEVHGQLNDVGEQQAEGAIEVVEEAKIRKAAKKAK